MSDEIRSEKGLLKHERDGGCLYARRKTAQVRRVPDVSERLRWWVICTVSEVAELVLEKEVGSRVKKRERPSELIFVAAGMVSVPRHKEKSCGGGCERSVGTSH